MNNIKKILVLNGPNLNLLGRREPKIYGNISLSEIENNLLSLQNKLSVKIDCIQSNNEGELINIVQEANEKYSGMIINAGGYSHTSIALMDALKFFGRPIIEVHMSNIYIRENFRHISYISKVANGSICGFGAEGYEMAINCIIKLIDVDYN
ncbi:MAG: 3-dehydroquinate dehydratase [Alphaproteobacteria bacterium MarineAlpha9_Bin3]|nr:MAG: 3-dehydroquinate dehydratase [Alphaproteobacteria bacterium MarineAlpha9_Bin3]